VAGLEKTRPWGSNLSADPRVVYSAGTVPAGVTFEVMVMFYFSSGRRPGL
jgi:hypothetical protein